MSEDAGETELVGETDEATLEPPKDVEGWRELLTVLPPAALLKMLQEERGRTERIFAGFRPNPVGLNLPIVRDRLIKEAQKRPDLAKSLALLYLKTSLSPKMLKTETTQTDTTKILKSEERLPLPPADGADTVAALRAKLDKHRGTIHAQEQRIKTLETRLTGAEREAQKSRAELSVAHAAERSAAERLDRIQRQKERDERRPVAPAAPKEKTALITAAAPAPVPAPPLFEETIQRLLDAGRVAQVVDLCRYALRTEAAEDSATVRGHVHASLADALRRSSDAAGSVAEGRAAVTAFLDGGDAPGAANALALWTAQSDTIRKEDAVQISRLMRLAEATGKTKIVQDIFLRLSLASPATFKRVRASLPPSEAAKLKTEAAPSSPPPFGMNEVFSMPVVPHALSPRRIVRAVDAGEEELVTQVREGIAEWRRRDKAGNQYADALLITIERIAAAVSAPLRHEPREAVVVDASNVARRTPDPLILDATGRVAYLTSMRDHLLREGYFPVILIADANLSYQIDDPPAYLSLVERRVITEVPGGESADEALIKEARQRRAPLVTNDRLRDWRGIADLRRLDFIILPDRILLEAVPLSSDFMEKESAN